MKFARIFLVTVLLVTSLQACGSPNKETDTDSNDLPNEERVPKKQPVQ